MKPTALFAANRCRLLALCLPALLALPGCAREDVPVSIHGVNYSGQTFYFTVEDPTNPKNKGGGETISAYSAGGIQCCYTLPATWRPGLKVQVNSKYWLQKKPDGTLPEVEARHTIDVPRYADGKPGELWVLRGKDGALAIVSSDLQPDHAQWPGAVKGWPVPSVEYQRERWALYLSLAEANLRSAQEQQHDMANDMHKYITEMWPLLQTHRSHDVAVFSGPDDPRLRTFLIEENRAQLAHFEEKVRLLKEHRP